MIWISYFLPFQKWLDISDGRGGIIYKDLSAYLYPYLLLYFTYYTIECLQSVGKLEKPLSRKNVLISSTIYAASITLFQALLSTVNRRIGYPDDLNYVAITIYNFTYFFIAAIVFILIFDRWKAPKLKEHNSNEQN